MQLKLTTIDPYTCSLDELESEIIRINNIKNDQFNKEQSIKIFINSIYGALASPYFIGYNIFAAEAVTLQGQDMIHFTNKILDDYFLNQWHLDVATHQKLGITNVKQIMEETVVVYNDTDSIFSSAIIKTNNGAKTIENLYNENIKNGSSGITLKGHESVKTNDKVLNWTKDNKLYYAPIKRIIRHKVTKSKWRLKTKSGKEVIITNDHSLIVFRDHVQIEIKPKDILKSDKILCIK